MGEEKSWPGAGMEGCGCWALMVSFAGICAVLTEYQSLNWLTSTMTGAWRQWLVIEEER
jgi:hypothetical protein